MADVQTQLDTLAANPGDLTALEAVETEFASASRWEELLRVYEDSATRLESEDAALLWRKAANVCLQSLASGPRAELYLKRALSASPGDVPALQALRELYVARGDYELAAETWEKEASHLQDAAARAAGFVALAELYLHQLSRHDKALAALRQAVRADASNPDAHKLRASIFELQGRLEQAHDALLAELEARGDDEELAIRLGHLAERLLERPKLHERARAAAQAIMRYRPNDQVIDRVNQELEAYREHWDQKVSELSEKARYYEGQDKRQAADIWLSIAEIQQVYAEQPEAALQSVDKAFANRPGHEAALRLLEEIYGSEDRFDELSLKLEMMAAYTREPDIAVELYLKAAMHHAVRLDDPDAAARIYQRVLDLQPGNKVASNALAEYYRERQSWQEALAVLTQWAEKATQAPDKVAAHYACSRIYEEELDDKAGARRHYEAILDLDPENQAAARALESVYRDTGDHAALARVLKAKLAGLAGAQREPVLSELSALYAGPLADPEQALQVMGELYEAAPSAELREQLEELAARSNNFAALVRILENGIEQVADDTDRVEALHSLAALYEGARDAPLEALRIHRRILSLTPGDERARNALQRLLESVAETDDKLAIYREQADAAAAPQEKVQLLHKLATELVESAKDYVRAIDVYREILRLAPDDAHAVDGLLVLYRRDNRWGEVSEMLTRKLEQTAANAQRVPILLELADISERQLGDLDTAVERYVEVLDADSQCSEAVTGLERLIANARRPETIAERLQPIFERNERWDDVARMLEIRAGAAAEVEQGAALLRDLAEVYEQRLNAPEQALGAYLRAFQAEPAASGVDAELERLGVQTGDVSSVLRAFRSGALVLEGELQAKTVLRAGRLAEQQGELQGAVVDYLRAIGIGGEAQLEAGLEGLRRVLSAAGLSSDRLSEAASQVAENLEANQLASFWRQLAQIYERDMNQPNAAIAAWKQVLAVQASDAEAARQLDRLYETAAEPTALVEHLREKMEAAADDADKAALGGQIAEVLADQIGDIAGAVDALNDVAQRAPGQRLVWQRLAGLHADLGQFNEAAQAMHRELSLLAEGDARHSRLVDYARLVGKQLGDVPTALGALQSVTATQPSHTDAVSLLEELLPLAEADAARGVAEQLLQGYRAGEQWERAVELLGRLASDAADPAQEASLLQESAKIKSESLADAQGAYADLERAFRLVPTDEPLRFQLEQAATHAGAWEALVTAYEAALSIIDESTLQQAIRRKLAELLERLGRAEEAVEHYKAAGGGELPEDLESLEALERLLREQGRQEELYSVLESIAARLPSDAADRRKKLLLEMGSIAEEQLLDKPRAIEVYRKLIEAAPGELEPLRRLERLLAELGEPADLAPVLDKLIEVGNTNPQLVDDYIKRARVATQLEDFESAFNHYRSALLKKREYPDAVAGLEELIEVAPNKLEIAQVLEPIYTAKQNHEMLAWVLERRLGATEERAQRKSLLRRIGDIYENRLQRPDRAFAMARQSLGEDPSDMGVRMWIEKLAGETEAQRELADAYVEEAEKATEDSKLSLQFHRRAAALLHEKLADTAGAVSEYQAILDLEPRDEKALSGLESIFREHESYAELVALLQRRLEHTAGLERRREYLNEIASLQSAQLGDLSAAVETNKQILQLTPDDTAAFEQVETLLSTLSSWEELNRFYEDEIERLSNKRGRDPVARRVELTYRKARVIDEQFGDAEQAGTLFEAVLQENPAHANTLAYLQQRAGNGSLMAIELLESVYREQGQWQQYIDLLESKLQLIPETEQRRGIYLAIAGAYDQQLQTGDMAFMAVSRAFNENRADVELLETLEELAERYGNWEELVEIVGTDIDALADAELRQRLLRKLGELCGERLGDVQRGVGYLQQALQYDPADSTALEQLDALLERHEMWAALADVLERRIELTNDPKEKSTLLERLASVWGDRLMDAEAALRCHNQILEIDPDHPLALKSMQKLYAEVQDWDSLAKNLHRQAQVLTEHEEQVRVHAAAGELYAEELNDNDAAIEHYHKVVGLEPGHEEANQALTVLLSAEERWDELAEHYRRQLALTQDANLKSDINRRLGVILGEKLGRSDDALHSWLEVLEVEPKNLDALRALLRLYGERAMWEEFVDIAKRLIPLAEPPEAKDVRFQLAKALGENLGRREEAIKLAREVRATEPHTANELVRLGDMLRNIEAFEEAVTAYEKAAPLEEEDAVAVTRYYQAAQLYAEQLGKPNAADEAYEAILEIKPDDFDAYTALSTIYRETGEWRKLVTLNESFVPTVDAATRLQLLTEIRDVQDQRLGEKELAFIAGCRVYKENPSDLQAVDALERLATDSDGAEELVAVIEDEVENVHDPDIKATTYRRIARVYDEFLHDVASAEEALGQLLVVRPGDLEALDKRAELGAREERYDKQVAALENKLEHVAEDQDRKAILLEIARIWEDKIGEMDEAVDALNRVLSIDGADINALDALVRIYSREQRWTELAHTLTRKVELSQDAQENIQLRLRVAGLCESELAEPDAAIQWYRGVLDFDPAHTETLSALERLYGNLERWSELIQILEWQLSQTADRDSQVHLLNKIAAIYESEFESEKDAVQSFERILQIDPGHMPSIRNLERLLRALGEWHRLIEILEHHITLLSDTQEKTALLLDIGEIYYRELSQVDKAEQVYNRARELNPGSGSALHALGKLYERSGNWFQSLDMLQKEADALGADPKALPVLTRLGRINDEMLMDMGAAESAYQRALEIDPTYAPALEALKEIARGKEDWEAYSEYLITEAETSDDEEEQTELFMEAARFFVDVREDEESAVRYYRRALEITPDNLEAARELAEIHFRNEQWSDARPLYEQVLASLDKNKDAKDFCQKSYRLAYINEKLGDTEQARHYYKRAFEADATYLPALEGYGQVLLATEQWDEAQKVFQTVLIHHRDSLTESEIVDVQWQIGDIALKQNQPDRAYKQFEKCLEVDPDHGPSLRALADLDKQMQNWEGAFGRLWRLAEVVPSNERAGVLMETSALAREQLGDVGRSVQALERARRMQQPPLDVLGALANDYMSAHQPQKAVEVLEQAVARDGDAERLSGLNFQLAQIYETAIKNEPLAVEKYNAALDLSPKNVQAFEAIERLLSTRQQWGLLEQNYRMMITRAKQLSQAVRLVLWRNLAELYRQVLHDVDAAIMAYEVIQKMEPGKLEDLQILMQLYAQKPERYMEAAELGHQLVNKLDNPIEPIRVLRQVYQAQRDFDAVYCLTGALMCLNAANDEEKQVFEYLRKGVPPKAEETLNEELWSEVSHPNLSGPLAQLLTVLYRNAYDFVSFAPKELGLRKKDRIDVRSSDLYFARIADHVGRVLTVRHFDLYRKSGSIEPLHILPSKPPALAAGENSDVFRDPSARVVLFHAGRQIAYMRPEMFLARVHVGEDLRHMLLGLCLVYNRNLQHDADPQAVEQWAAHFAKVPAAVLQRLQAPARDAYPVLAQSKSIATYAAAVEATAARAGLIACGDLSAAIRGVSEGGEGASGMPVRERIRELVLFSVSRPFLELRKAIGSALVEKKQAAQ